MTILLLCLTKKNRPPPYLALPGWRGRRIQTAAVLLAPKRCVFMLMWPMAAIRCDVAGSYQLPTIAQMRNVMIRSRSNDEYVDDFSASLFIIR